MWKKLKLIRILVKHGVPLVSELFEEYKTALASYIQRLDSVSRLTSRLIDSNPS